MSSGKWTDGEGASVVGSSFHVHPGHVACTAVRSRMWLKEPRATAGLAQGAVAALRFPHSTVYMYRCTSLLLYVVQYTLIEPVTRGDAHAICVSNCRHPTAWLAHSPPTRRRRGAEKRSHGELVGRPITSMAASAVAVTVQMVGSDQYSTVSPPARFDWRFPSSAP